MTYFVCRDNVKYIKAQQSKCVLRPFITCTL